MTIAKTLTTVTISVPRYWSHDAITAEAVTFTVFQDNEWFRAVPVLSAEERKTIGLPKELSFVYVNYCIVDANDMEDETLEVMKKIILELGVQDLI